MKITTGEIYGALRKGYTVAEIAELYQMTPQAINKRLRTSRDIDYPLPILAAKTKTKTKTKPKRVKVAKCPSEKELIISIEGLIQNEMESFPNQITEALCNNLSFSEYRDLAIRLLAGITHGSLSKLKSYYRGDSFAKNMITRIQKEQEKAI